MNEFLLQTENLCKQFKTQMAVNQISLNVKSSTVYGLLGPNGAGKSTLLKLIVNILKPNKGRILFDSHVITKTDLKNIGALIENPAIYGNLTAYENLKVHTLMDGINENRINEALQTVDLDINSKKLAANFSLGMKQRLGIAIALVGSPELLILDEPTNGLDPVGINDLRILIKKLIKRGMTIIYSSHILSEVSKVADDIGIIYNGKLLYEDKNDMNIDLEKLFMDVITRYKEGAQ